MAILLNLDAHSKFIDEHIWNAAISRATITKLRQTFATQGLISVLVSDNASKSASLKSSFYRLNGTHHITSAPFRPASNGAAERAVQTVKAGLRKTEVRDMESQLYRFLPQVTTVQAPADLLMGRKSRTRMILVQPDRPQRLPPRDSTLDGRWTRKPFGLSRVQPIYLSIPRPS